MNKRRRRLIDRKYQLSTTLKIMGIILIAFILIIATTAIISTTTNRRITDSVRELSIIIEKEDRVITGLVRNGAVREKQLIERHRSHMDAIDARISHLERIIFRNRIVIFSLVIIGILISLFLFFYLIRVTHRIAGPVYVLSRHIQDILNDRDPDFRELRKNDELREFYDDFISMVNKLRER